MTKGRSSMFGAGASAPDSDLDADEFQPGPIRRPDVPAARQAAEAGGFTSREPTSRPADTQRRHRTGRTVQVNLKMTEDYKARFLALADRLNASQNVTFERAIAALEEQLK